MTKSSGPRTEPWGTPQEEVCQEDRSVSHFTRKPRDDRYDLNQLRTEPWIPNQDEGIWHTVINYNQSSFTHSTNITSRDPLLGNLLT